MAYRPSDAMWSEAVALLARVDRMHREFFRPAGREGWEPPIDLLETADELILVAALPGVTLDELQVVISGGEVAIVGHRRWPEALRRARVHRMELPHGHFERRVHLPPGGYEIGRRDLTNGCLTLTLRKVR